jgi:hypothetical protein
MRAILLLRERHVLDESRFVEIVIWQVPKPVPGSAHDFKYRLALIVDDFCVLRFDNETGKGDHQHAEGGEAAYIFTTLERLIADFWQAVEGWRSS